MANPLTIQQFADLTDPRFREIMDGVFDRGEDFVPMIYTKVDATQETERGSALTPMGEFREFTSTGQVKYDGPDQGFDWRATNVEFALALQIQRRLWRWDQFNIIESRWELLGDSAFETRQVHAAMPLNDGHSVTSLLNFNHSRGEALFATAHASTRDGVGTANTSNLVTDALSRTALNTIRTTALQFRDDAGRTRGMNLDTLIIPPALLPEAEVLVQSSMIPDSNENAINPNYQRFRIIVWDKLTDQNDYFVVNMAALKRNLSWFEGDPLEYDRVLDFETKIAKYSGYMSYSTAWKDWRVGIKSRVT